MSNVHLADGSAAHGWGMLALVLACFIALPAVSYAVEEESDGTGETERAKAKSLDDELLDGLRGNGDEGIDETKRPSAQAKRSQSKRLDDELLQGLRNGEEGEGEDIQLEGEQDPLSKISGRMHEVERLIADADAGEGTQDKQREIADEMEKLIRQLQKQCQACKQASGKRPRNAASSRAGQGEQAQRPSDQPARDSSNRLDDKKAEKPDTAAMRDLVKAAWGHLPEHLRQQMEQSPSVEFLPQYLVLIEDYFKALAKENGRGRPERRSPDAER
jgi:hypothetical protein